MTTFSLIVPFHNSAEVDRRGYMGELLDSLPDRADLEVVLVDDHSEIPFVPARSFEATRVRVVPNRADRRYAGTARNTGLEACSGDVVFFADSDDLFVTEALSRAMDELRGEGGWDLCLARVTSFREDGRTGERHRYIDGAMDMFRRTGRHEHLVAYHNPAGKFIRRDFIEERGLRYGPTRVANDVLFAVGLALEAGRTRVFDAVVYRIREGNASLTSDLSRDAVRQRIGVERDVQALLRAKGREDLVPALYFRFKKLWRARRGTVLVEILRSLARGDKVMPRRGVLLRDLRDALRGGALPGMPGETKANTGEDR